MTDRRLMLRATTTAFSLVEVTLALGVVAFGLVAVIGVLPVALNTNRASIAQTRAVQLADTVFNGLRVQPFRAAVPGDDLLAEGSPPLPVLDLSTLGADQPDRYDGTTLLYALLTEITATASEDPRRLRFTADKTTFDNRRTGTGAAVSGYEITLAFCKRPAGTLAGGQASRVALTVRPTGGGASGRAAETFSFVTIIANRGS